MTLLCLLCRGENGGSKMEGLPTAPMRPSNWMVLFWVHIVCASSQLTTAFKGSPRQKQFYPQTAGVRNQCCLPGQPANSCLCCFWSLASLGELILREPILASLRLESELYMQSGGLRLQFPSEDEQSLHAKRQQEVCQPKHHHVEQGHLLQAMSRYQTPGLSHCPKSQR